MGWTLDTGDPPVALVVGLIRDTGDTGEGYIRLLINMLCINNYYEFHININTAVEESYEDAFPTSRTYHIPGMIYNL